MLVITLAAIAGVSVAVAWLVDQQRARLRNGQGSCGTCGTPLSESEPGHSHLIHGRFVCEPCAENARHRIPWHLGILAGATAVATGAIVAGEGLVALVLFPAASTVIMTAGALRLMKQANRNAERRIEAGDGAPPEALPGAMEGRGTE